MLNVQIDRYPVFCLCQYFPVNDFKYFDAVISNSKKIKLSKIKLELSAGTWMNKELRKWDEFLISGLSKNFELLISVRLDKFSDNIPLMLEQVFAHYGETISSIELTSSSRHLNLPVFKKTMKILRFHNKKVIVQSELADEIKLLTGDVVSVNYRGTENISAKIKKLQREYKCPVWITGLTVQTGLTDEFTQVNILANTAQSGAERVYWNNLIDTEPEKNDSEDMLNSGLISASGLSKTSFRLLEKEGMAGLIEFSNLIKKNKFKKYSDTLSHLDIIKNNKTAVIFGGSGFIGTNVADKYLADGYNVRIFDNISRPGVEENLKWLLQKHGNKVDTEIADVRDFNKVYSAVKGASVVFNFAAQVAVTTSLQDPMHDFEVNIKGTVNILESLRKLNQAVPLIFTSTNKVYGGFTDLRIKEEKTRYEPEQENIRRNGISEARPLDFHSPYGCSKGSADQYVLDYCRSYQLPTVVFRMSCIYGPHQFGNEDQGWVAHFLIQTIKNKPIILYGDGKQVRDILFVKDLVIAFQLAQKNIAALAGNAFNIGGGVENTISLVELLDYITELTGVRSQVSYSTWRTGDQKYYVSDISKFSSLTGWTPAFNVRQGIAGLYSWLINNYPFGKDAAHLKEEINKEPEKKALAS